MMKLLNVVFAVVVSAVGVQGWFAHSVKVSIPQVALQQDPRTGNFPNEPAEYPDGVMCTPQGINYHGLQTKDSPCTCKNMWRDSDGDEGCCDVRVTNDSTCQQWCHENRCACPHICVPGKSDETQTPDDGGR